MSSIYELKKKSDGLGLFCFCNSGTLERNLNAHSAAGSLFSHTGQVEMGVKRTQNDLQQLNKREIMFPEQTFKSKQCDQGGRLRVWWSTVVFAIYIYIWYILVSNSELRVKRFCGVALFSAAAHHRGATDQAE